MGLTGREGGRYFIVGKEIFPFFEFMVCSAVLLDEMEDTAACRLGRGVYTLSNC